MEVKLFEVRDEGTCIPVVAIQTAATNDAEGWLLMRAVYASNMRYVLLSPLTGGRPMHYDPQEWTSEGSRTLAVAHEYIRKYWGWLQTGEVVDVQYVLGEAAQPKASDRFAEV